MKYDASNSKLTINPNKEESTIASNITTDTETDIISNPFDDSSDPETQEGAQTTLINDVEVTVNPDGSTSFTLGKENISLSNQMMTDINTVMETAGASGLNNEVMRAIQKLIRDHEDEYPPDQIPLEMKFGQGTRNEKYTDSDKINFLGSAELNMIKLSVDDHMIVIQRDQTHDSINNFDQDLDLVNHVFEGYKDGNRFTGEITSSGNEDYKGIKYSGTIDGNKMAGQVTTTKNLMRTRWSTGEPYDIDSWDFDFNGSDYQL